MKKSKLIKGIKFTGFGKSKQPATVEPVAPVDPAQLDTSSRRARPRPKQKVVQIFKAPGQPDKVTIQHKAPSTRQAKIERIQTTAPRISPKFKPLA